MWDIRDYFNGLLTLLRCGTVDFLAHGASRRRQNTAAPQRDIGFVDVDCYFKVFELAVFGGGRI
jgi:hypothetical protein